jgi:glucose-1-phosphate cytidylyltransferase
MKIVILAGGLGTRLQDDTAVKPKPMVEIGGRPMLWHIMTHYARYGFKEFCIALGHKGDVIKQYFRDYALLNGCLTVDLATGRMESKDKQIEDWTIHLVPTGLDTLTGGRVKRLQPVLGNETFMLTYGDGVADIDIRALLAFHRANSRIATVTAVRPPARFGGVELERDSVRTFSEKPSVGEGWINGGFFVFEPGVFDYLKDDRTVLEADALERIAADGQLGAYRHTGFWQCMDTPRDLRALESAWQDGHAPWLGQSPARS